MNGLFLNNIAGDLKEAAIIDEKTAQDGSLIIYYGYVLPSTSNSDDTQWLLKKVTKTEAGITMIQYPNGDQSYAYSWDKRATYNYKFNANYK
jgi:hypothetical protein